MKNNKLFCCKLFALINLMVGMLQYNNTIITYAKENYDTKIYSDFNINDDFDEETVIVIMDKLLSKKNKIHSIDFFGKEIKSIKDLTCGSVNVLGKNFEQILELTLHNKSKENVINVIKTLEKIPGIKYAAPNYIVTLEENAYDTYYPSNSLWGLNNINIQSVWEHTTGNSNIRVGVIDSGIAFHPDLINNLEQGYDFAIENTITHDDATGHGTLVAGIIGAKGTNDFGISGVNSNISIVPLQVTNYGASIVTSDCVEAINEATRSFESSNPIQVLNFSLGYYKENISLETAIRQYPGLFVCAAGNEEHNTDDSRYYHYPSFYGSSLHSSPINNIISVGAIDENNERSIWDSDESSSNYGKSTVHIYAPGSNIISTYPENLYVQNGDGHVSVGYYNNGGTSFSTPYVTGVAALLLSLKSDLTPLQLKYAILNSADTITITLPDGTHQNVKKLNAYSAMKYIFGTQTYGLSLQYGNESYSTNITGTSSYYLEKNSLIRLAVHENYDYNISISSTSPINATLYDSDINIVSITPNYMNSNCSISFTKNLSIGTYYLKTNYVNSEVNGTINYTVNGPSHAHSYTGWMYYNRISHIEVCECGTIGTTTQPHAVSPSDKYKDKANCIGCGAIINLTGGGGITIVPGPSNINRKITINGSYILPNGIIVLVDEDIEDYLSNTLVFYDEDYVPVTE